MLVIDRRRIFDGGLILIDYRLLKIKKLTDELPFVKSDERPPRKNEIFSTCSCQKIFILNIYSLAVILPRNYFTRIAACKDCPISGLRRAITLPTQLPFPQLPLELRLPSTYTPSMIEYPFRDQTACL